MTEPEDTPDRRDATRTPIELRVEYRRLNMFFADYTRNISKGGTFIRTDNPLELGTEFVFSLIVPTLKEPLSLIGKVMWTIPEDKATEEQPAGMGIEFQYRDPEERARVAAFVYKTMARELGEELAARLLVEDED